MPLKSLNIFAVLGMALIAVPSFSQDVVAPSGDSSSHADAPAAKSAPRPREVLGSRSHPGMDPVSEPSKKELADRVEVQSDAYYSAKSRAIWGNAVGTGLYVVGLALVIDGLGKAIDCVSNDYNSSRECNDDGEATMGLIALYGSAPFFIVGEIGLVQAIIRGVKLKRRKLGLSLATSF
jgi:hypothetical protein